MKKLVARVVLATLLVAPAAALADPDLELTKSGPASAVAGTAVVYDFYIYNDGSDPAQNVALHDVLPAGLILIDDSLNSCTVTSTVAGGAAKGQQTVDCSLPDIPDGESLSMKMQVLVEPDFITDRGVTFATNTATVTTDDELFPDDNTDSAPAMNITAEADVQITLLTSAAAGPVPAGEEFTYTIIVENLGPSTAENIIIRDTLVASNFVRANGCSLSVRTDGGLIDEFDCNFALSTGVFDLATMGSNWLNPRGSICDWDSTESTFGCDGEPGVRDEGRIVITINMTATEAGTMEDLAVVTSDTPDPDMANNSATEIGGFESVADLEVQKTAGSPVNAGEVATWDVTVINHGPSASANVRLLDRLPSGLVGGTIQITGNIYEDILGTPVEGDPISCTLGTPGNPTDPAVCDLGGLPDGWGALLTVSGLVDPAYIARHGGIAPPIGMTNDVEVTSDTLDAAFENCVGVYPCPPAPDKPNFASATVEVGESADLNLKKIAVGPAAAGEAFHYEIQVGNAGPSVARDVTLRDFLPSGLHFLEAAVDLEGATGFDPLPCTVAAGSNALFCPLGDLPLTGSAPILVFVDVLVDLGVPDGTGLVNHADVLLADTPDPNGGDNSDSAPIVVTNPTPDFFTESFGPGAIDLEGWQLELIPAYSLDGYEACITAVTAPDAISTAIHHLNLYDDNFVQISISGDSRVQLYGQKYKTLFVGSNGYVTFLQGDIAHLGNLPTHFDLPRVAALFTDLDPGHGGEVWWTQMADRVLIAWEGVKAYNLPTTNTVYLELFFDGRLRWKFEEIGTTALPSLVGISGGTGVPVPFFASNFAPPSSDYPLCPLIFADSFESHDTSRWSSTAP